MVRPLPYENLSCYTLPSRLLKLANLISLNGFASIEQYSPAREKENCCFIEALSQIQTFLHYKPLTKTARLNSKLCQEWLQKAHFPDPHRKEQATFMAV